MACSSAAHEGLARRLLAALRRLLLDSAWSCPARAIRRWAGFSAAATSGPTIAYIDRIDDNQRRRLYAASDLALIARRRASAETSQLVAQRYGAVPVALATGAIVDTVVDVDATLDTGTGFLFDRPEAADLVAALERALAAYSSADNWARLRRRVMRLDLGWDRPARRYAQVYRRALELASG